jgi:hypothetical protein
MAERAAELIAEGADGSSLARFEACANEWLAGQGVADPPFRILSELGHKGVAWQLQDDACMEGSRGAATLETSCNIVLRHSPSRSTIRRIGLLLP